MSETKGSKEIAFIDVDDAFSSTQNRPTLDGSDSSDSANNTEKTHPEKVKPTASRKPRKARKSKSSKASKNEGERKCISVYLPQEIYQKVMSASFKKTMDEQKFCSASALIRELVVRGVK